MDIRVGSFNPNKHLKEEFVSNLTGSSMFEIAALSAIVPAMIVFRKWDLLKSVGLTDHGSSGAACCQQNVLKLALDYLFVVLPTTLIFNVLSDWTNISAVCVMLLLILSIAIGRTFRSYHVKENLESSIALRRMISSYRVSIMITTCLCILAVDFKIFPRRYGKTETYGTGLMDLGVGSFVVANSLVSRHARHAITLKHRSSLRAISPLILLGFARLIFTRGVDYQVHVGEYGVHWNFFFTLAAVSLLSSHFQIPPQYCGILGLLLLLVYQAGLLFGLNEYLISRERALNLFSQNKEGIFSLFGYWSMYLIGINLGYYLFFRENARKTGTNVILKKVWLLCILFWVFTVLLDNYVEKVSRRMCNMAYVTLVLAQNLQVLGILMLSDLFPRSKMLILEEAYDQNLLASFLLANILTGLVNLTVDTLFVSSTTSLAVLMAYSMSLTLLVGCAKHYNLRLKFW